ncbi:glycosyltransferase [Allosphingosinicella indica]|uniref:Glycosyltransferase involved in cell wall bisynthesis n=1 Tax=Allosphingosinicella indica TaxID=941907 RepID=A0A1X7H3W3_9SPHN|nr:glycosyltransferase [Allosphingosinicella indica]SMF78496.1 Glycosyltransferase involved in cell wall bisynthesis [Allosphingosinicella indica]
MPVRILHAHSTFSLGGKEARATRLMNAFGDAAEHSILSAMPDRLEARDAVAQGVVAQYPDDAPPLTGMPGLPRLFRLSRYLKRFDLVLSYNWGAFDAVMARYLFGGPPLIHHEDGFNEDEAARLKPRRNLYRRLGLSGTHRLVVPSARLETVARTAWAQPAERIVLIANGIAVGRYAQPPEPGAIPGFERRPGELVVGTVAGLRAVKNLPRLVRCFAAADLADARLVIVGEGPEAERIAREAGALGIGNRVLLPGFLADPHRWIGHFDIFALSSDSEQAPISLIEAMAAGLPVVATAVGDVPAMVADDNRPLIVAPEDEAGFAAALRTLAERRDLRRTIGAANRARAVAEHDEDAMIRDYAALYEGAISRPGALYRPRG